VEAVRSVSVSLPSSCRRRVPWVQTHVLTPPSFLPFSCRLLWCGADGDRDFLFFSYKLLYIDGAQSKLLSKIHVVCIVIRRVHVKNTSWTPGCKLPKGGHTHLVKKHQFCFDQMTPSRELLTRAFLSCAFVSYNCESACIFSFSSHRSRGFRDC